MVNTAINEIAYLPPGYRTKITFPLWELSFSQFTAIAPLISSDSLGGRNTGYITYQSTPHIYDVVLNESNPNPNNISIDFKTPDLIDNGDSSKVYLYGSEYTCKYGYFNTALILNKYLSDIATVQSNYYGTFSVEISLAYAYRTRGTPDSPNTYGYFSNNRTCRGTLNISSSGLSMTYSSTPSQIMIGYYNYSSISDIKIGVKSITIS